MDFSFVTLVGQSSYMHISTSWQAILHMCKPHPLCIAQLIFGASHAALIMQQESCEKHMYDIWHPRIYV